MYVTRLQVFGSKRYPLMLSAVYEAIAMAYDLPSLETLSKAAQGKEVEWPTTSGLQVYYLEQMLEQQEDAVYQIRWRYSKEGRDLLSLYLSIHQTAAKNLTVQFPGRSGRGSFSKILGILKSTMHKLNLKDGDIDVEIEGFPEVGPSKYIKENAVSSLVWIPGFNRYFHVREDVTRHPDYAKEMKHAREHGLD